MASSLTRRVLVSSNPASLFRLCAPSLTCSIRSSLSSCSNSFALNGIRQISSSSSTSTQSEMNGRSSLWMAASVAALATTFSTMIAFNSESDDKIERSGLSPKDFRPFTIHKISPYNHDTKLYVLKLKDPSVKDVLPITSFILVRAIIDGKEEIRPYTPIESHTPGELKLLIKSYPNGKVSKYFGTLKEGDNVEVKGPLAKLAYTPNLKKEIGALIGGTGITPALQLFDHILRDPKDKTKITLLFANKTSGDILLKEKLDVMQRFAPDRFKVYYVIDKAEQKWNGEVGYLTPDMISRYMPKPSNDNLVVVCGPQPFYKLVSGTKAPDYSQGEVDGHLKTLGYTKDQVFKF